jgi:hypothetical protein
VTDLALREIRYGRVWRANAARVVEERGEELVLWSPAGIARKVPLDPAGAEIRIPQPEWTLGDRITPDESLVVVRPGARWSLWHFWNQGRFVFWYVNFERHLGRTATCLDYVDDKLDLVVAPDGTVRWKDEDELELAAAAGHVDADEVRAEAEAVLASPPWPTGWEDWRPDPVWEPPRLPDGWDSVSG